MESRRQRVNGRLDNPKKATGEMAGGWSVRSGGWCDYQALGLL
jgi:hypothetical protein